MPLGENDHSRAYCVITWVYPDWQLFHIQLYWLLLACPTSAASRSKVELLHSYKVLTITHPNSWLHNILSEICAWCCLCFPTITCIPTASAVSHCTARNLSLLLRSQPALAVSTKANTAKHPPFFCLPLPDKQELFSFHETNRFTNLSSCTGTEFKGELWFATASPVREASSAGNKMSHWLHCLFCSPRASQMEMESITGQQPAESTWRLLSCVQPRQNT